MLLGEGQGTCLTPSTCSQKSDLIEEAFGYV